MHTLLIQFIKKILPQITDNEVEIFCQQFHPLQVNKGAIIMAEGVIADKMFFINEGCVRAYYIQENGSEATRYINFEGNFVTALSSFITQQPATDVIEAVENCSLLQISRVHFFNLIEQYLIFEKLYRKSLEFGMVHNIWRLETLISMDASTRYKHLLQTQPYLIQRLTNKIVASYLGITQESLSRIKAGKY